jgi:hypothetical protein
MSNKHEISLQTAVDMTTRYRMNQLPAFSVCETFEIEAVRKLMDTQGCAFLRIYYGMKEDRNAHAILVAVNAENEDILPSESVAEKAGDNPPILEDGYRCPPGCPKPSPLYP